MYGSMSFMYTFNRQFDYCRRVSIKGLVWQMSIAVCVDIRTEQPQTHVVHKKVRFQFVYRHNILIPHENPKINIFRHNASDILCWCCVYLPWPDVDVKGKQSEAQAGRQGDG